MAEINSRIEKLEKEFKQNYKKVEEKNDKKLGRIKGRN
jgi:hypothetical protein